MRKQKTLLFLLSFFLLFILVGVVKELYYRDGFEGMVYNPTPNSAEQTDLLAEPEESNKPNPPVENHMKVIADAVGLCK